MDALLALAETRGIAVIEDAAQAHGSLYKGRKVGTIGRAGCFSFWEDKIITTGGEGGCVITDDDALADRMRRIRHHGEGPVEGERAYYHLELGYNYRMSSMYAATGLVQLRRLDEYLDARRGTLRTSLSASPRSKASIRHTSPPTACTATTSTSVASAPTPASTSTGSWRRRC